MVDPDGHAACRVLADECADASARSQLAALRSAAAAADAAVRAAVRAAERADAAAARAQAAADQPCRLGDPDDCASWRHSRTAEANRARAAARTAWSIVSAVARNAAQAHRAVAQAERAQAAAKRRGIGAKPAGKPRGSPAYPLVAAGASIARFATGSGQLAIDVAVGLRARASTLGTVLGTSDNPALRSKAARLLPGAGSATKFAASSVFRVVARGAPFVGGGVDFVANVVEGQSLPEAGVRAGVPTAAGALGGMAGAFACGVVGIATMGIGGVACAGLVAGFSIVLSGVADRAVDTVIGPPTGRDEH